MKKIIIVVLMLFSMSVIAQESVLLRVNCKQGDKFSTKIFTKKNHTISSSKELISYETTTVKKVVDSIYVFEMSVDRLIIKGKHNGEDIKYDSSVKEENMTKNTVWYHYMAKPSLETKIAIATNKKGKILDKKRLSGSEDISRAIHTINFITFPKKPVSIGTEWKEEKTENNVKTVKTYKVTKITNAKVILSFEGQKYDVYIPRKKDTVVGIIEIDRKTGMPIKKELKRDGIFTGNREQSDVIVTIKKK